MNNRLIRVTCSIVSMALAATVGAGTKTWNPTVSSGGSYMWSEAANWLEGGVATTAPANGDSLEFDSSSAAITAVNDCTGLQVAGIAFSGSNAITLSGNKIDLATDGVLSAANAPITVTLALPMDVTGMATFLVTTNGTTDGTTFELTGAIGGSGGIQTGGNNAGTYNFRAANTYAGMTYLTNGLGYHVYNGGAFGSTAAGTDYRTWQLTPKVKADLVASPLYFHGVTIDEPFIIYGNQAKSLTFVANTTNVLNGSIYSRDSNNVERWTVESRAKVVMNGPVDLTATAQLNVSGELFFSNTVTMTRNPSTLRNNIDVGCTIHYAGDMNIGSVFQMYAGRGVASLEKADIFGASGAKVSIRQSGTLRVAGGHQYFSRLFRASDAATNGTAIVSNAIVTSADGTEIELTGTNDSDNPGSFGGSVRLNLASGAKFKPADQGQSIGCLMTNGVQVARFQSYGATGSGADVIDDTHFTGTGKLIVDGMQTKVWTGGAAGGNLESDANWSPLGAPIAGDVVTITGCTSGATFTGNLALGAGASLLISDSPSVTFAGNITLSGSGTATIDVAEGSVAYFTGVISGPASAALLTTGAGDIHFSGENTFDGNMTIKNKYFYVESNGALGSTAGNTTLNRSSFPSVQTIYFAGTTNAEEIVVHGSGGQGNHCVFSGANIFNGAWTRTAEQFRFGIISNTYIEFNHDFDDIGYLTFTAIDNNVSGSVVVFNASFTAGQPRLGGSALYIFTKEWNYYTANATPRIPNYGFTYNINGGIMRFDGDYLLNRGDKTPSLRFTGSSDAVIDLYGHDEEVAAIVGKGAAGHPVTITSTAGPATLHVLNNLDDTYNSGVYSDKFSGELSVSVEGASPKDALILAGVSDSTGTLIATNGGKIVMNNGATWVGDVAIYDASQLEIANATTAFGEYTRLSVENGGKLKLTSGTLTVAALDLGGVIGVDGKTYGPVGSGADVESALLEGAGTIRVVVPVLGTTRTWQGAPGGTWSTAANWSPAGVPSENDVLVFNSSAAAVDSTNDISGLTLLGLEFSGANAIALSGAGIGFRSGAYLRAEESNAGITMGIPLAVPEDGLTITATSNTAGAVTWDFTAPFSGAGDITFAGDHSATVNFRGDSPAFDGVLYLYNAAAYHVWSDGAFGSTAGATYYRVYAGNAIDNVEHFVSPLWLHGVTTDENLVLGSYCSFGLCIASGTTNVLNGTVDGISPETNPVTERWWIGTNACVRFNETVGCRSQRDSHNFRFIILYGQPGCYVEFNGRCNGGNLRQRMVDSTGVLAINHPLEPDTSYLGMYYAGLVKFGCWDALYADSERPVELQFSTVHPNMIDLGGYDQTFAKLFDHYYMHNTTVTNSGAPATLTLMATNALIFRMSLVGDLGLCLASNVTFTLTGKLAATGPLTLMNGTTLAFDCADAWAGTEVAVTDASRLMLDTTRLDPATALSLSGGGKVVVSDGVMQQLASLTIDGVSQTAMRSYGSSQSSADVKDDTHFEGKGVVYVVGEMSNVTRTWAGPSGGYWNVAANWSPAGVPQTGDTLVFDATSAAIDAVNDLGLFYARDVQMRGANGIRLSGNTLGLLDAGGISAAGGTATIELGLDTRATSSDLAVDIQPTAGATMTFLGAIGGDAAIVVGGAGKVEFKGANTFDGVLTVTNGEFHAYGNAAFGSTAGKTVFRAPTDVACEYWFHDVCTADAMEWYQPDGSFRGFFAAGTTNAFNGTFTGLGSGQPRMVFYANACVTFGNVVTNVGYFTVNSYAGSALDVRAPFYCSQLRFSGSGSLFVRDQLVEDSSPYALAFNPNGHQNIYLMVADALCVPDDMIESFGAAALALDNGMLDLCGNSQHAAFFIGGASVMVTNSGAAATLHVLQTARGNADDKWAVPLYGGAFKGVVAGPISLSFEGNPNPVPALFNTTDYLIATQRLTGVSTASGALIATNSAIVSVEGDGRWVGTNVTVYADSKVMLGTSGALAREADVFLQSGGKLVLEEGVLQRCRFLYIDGVRQRRGTWGSGEAGAPAVDVIDATHFEGKGVFRAMGITGTALNFR